MRECKSLFYYVNYSTTCNINELNELICVRVCDFVCFAMKLKFRNKNLNLLAVFSHN